MTTTKMKFTPAYKPNQLLCGNGCTAVVTGWTTMAAVEKKLNPDQFAVIGHLYSRTRGISFLIRNLLLNPHVRFLVVLNGTREDENAGSCQCLLDFFRHGFYEGVSDAGRRCWVIKSRRLGYIDIEIDIEALEVLRQSIEYQEVKSIKEATELVSQYAQRHPLEPWGTPLQFPSSEIVQTVLPGPRYGHRIEGRTIAETWVKIIHAIKTTGTIRPTGYDDKWQELIDLIAIVTDEPEEFYFPEPNYLPVDSAFIKEYVSQILDDSPYREGVKYTYGNRLRSWFGSDQIEQVIGKLMADPDAASAVMSLWDTKDHDAGGSPCLNHIWTRIVEGELSLTATFRSNDMFSAWPANAMGLRALQRHIRDEIVSRSGQNLVMGPLITISQSAHIYGDTWENADHLIREQYAKITQQPTYTDPVGNFIIEIIGNEINVSQTTPSGEVVACHTGKNPLKVLRDICRASPALQSEHAGYLGIELQKAASCLKAGTKYVQDTL